MRTSIYNEFQVQPCIYHKVRTASTTLTSATAGFISGDATHSITGGSIPGSTTITTVTNGTTIVLSNAATASATGVTIHWTRVVADGVTTSGSPTVTSATAAFASTDVGGAFSGAGIPANTTILSVTNATTAVLSANATATATTVSFTFTKTVNDAVTTGGTVSGTAVDLNHNKQDFRTAMAIITSGTITDGNYAFSMEESVDGNTWSAVPTARIEGTLPQTVGAAQSNSFYEVGYITDEEDGFRYVRVTGTQSGATTGGTIGAVFILGEPQQTPVVRP